MHDYRWNPLWRAFGNRTSGPGGSRGAVRGISGRVRPAAWTFASRRGPALSTPICVQWSVHCLWPLLTWQPVIIRARTTAVISHWHCLAAALAESKLRIRWSCKLQVRAHNFGGRRLCCSAMLLRTHYRSRNV